MRPRSLDEFVGQADVVGEKSLLGWRWADRATCRRCPLGPAGIRKDNPGALDRRHDMPNSSHSLRSCRCQRGSRRDRRGPEEPAPGSANHPLYRRNPSLQQGPARRPPGCRRGWHVTPIGATTENPSFEVNAALLSRCRVVVLEPLAAEDTPGSSRAHDDRNAALRRQPALTPDLIDKLAEWSGGDARVALHPRGRRRGNEPAGETAAARSSKRPSSRLRPSPLCLRPAGRRPRQLASALIKSVRNSDANAALYWLARMIEGGADPLFIARRLWDPRFRRRRPR